MSRVRACLCVLMIVFGTVGQADTSVYEVPSSPELRESFSICGEPELIRITDRVYLAFAFALLRQGEIQTAGNAEQFLRLLN